MARDLPEAWRHLFELRNVANMTALANMIPGIGTSTVINAITGDPKSSPETLQAIAKALQVDYFVVEEKRAQVMEAQGLNPLRFRPEDVSLLTTPQRDIVEALVKQFADDRRSVQQADQAKVTSLADKRRKAKGSRPNPVPPSMREGELYAAQDSDEPKGADPAGKDDGEE